jgi:hypothetical protein
MDDITDFITIPFVEIYYTFKNVFEKVYCRPVRSVATQTEEPLTISVESQTKKTGWF